MDEKDRRQAAYAAYFLDALFAHQQERSDPGTVKAELSADAAAGTTSAYMRAMICLDSVKISLFLFPKHPSYSDG